MLLGLGAPLVLDDFERRDSGDIRIPFLLLFFTILNSTSIAQCISPAKTGIISRAGKVTRLTYPEGPLLTSTVSSNAISHHSQRCVGKKVRFRRR